MTLGGRRPRVRFLVPRRPDGGRRDRLWAFCREWWTTRFPEIEMVEGASPPGLFNRGAAINAATEGPWGLAVILDTDVVQEPELLQEALERASTGRLTLPFTRYTALDEAMTARVMAGFNGSWDMRRAHRKMSTHVSSVVVVPRALWDAVGGFDERFVGWGHDDVAFAQACRVLGGGIDRVDGDVWHLHHPFSTERQLRSPRFHASRALAQRYYRATTPTAMREVIAERVHGDGVALIVVSNGRRECIEAAVRSARENLVGNIRRRIVVDDSADPEFHAWVRWRLDETDWELVAGDKALGFGGNVVRARDVALETGMPWVFWLEEDFTFNRKVDLWAMQSVLAAHPHLTQMALRRQPWFPQEIAAGGVVEQDPGAYKDHEDDWGAWLEHRKFWTTNPHLVTREFLSEFEWPKGAHSERRFADVVLQGGRMSGYWGRRDDAPWVTHDGERKGHGY